MGSVWALKGTDLDVGGNIYYEVPPVDENSTPLTFSYSDEVSDASTLSTKATTLTATVIDCETTVESVDIPKRVLHNEKIYLVTAIDASAFEECSAMASVTIPSSVAKNRKFCI